MLYPDTLLTPGQEKKESNLRNMVLETSRFPFIFILPQPTSMGSVGFDPTSTDFQSVVFTRLAYFPAVIFPVIVHEKNLLPKNETDDLLIIQNYKHD